LGTCCEQQKAGLSAELGIENHAFFEVCHRCLAVDEIGGSHPDCGEGVDCREPEWRARALPESFDGFGRSSPPRQHLLILECNVEQMPPDGDPVLVVGILGP
jgi:hypothetical protein